jgi:hypothetical protein
MTQKRKTNKLIRVKKKFQKNTNKRLKYNKNKTKKAKLYNKDRNPVKKISKEDAFNNFIDYVNISFLTTGANSVTFVAELPDSYINKSPYTDYSYLAKAYGKHIKYLIIEVAFLFNPKDKKYLKTDSDKQIFDENKLNIRFDGLKNLALTNEKDFIHEIEIQKDVYLKTMDYLEPICPAIVYSKIEKKSENIIDILNKFKTGAKNNDKAKQLFNSFLEKRADYDYIGIVGMEYAGKYKTLYSLLNSPTVTPSNKKLYKEMSMYLLLELADKAEYTHGNFYGGNILINTVVEGYFKGVIGKPLLIDFSYTKKIDRPLLSEIKKLYFDKKYVSALQKICSVNRRDNIENPSYYDWICESTMNNKHSDSDKNASLVHLLERRNQTIQELTLNFNSEHISGPQLPLTEKDKKDIVKKVETPT